MILHAMMCLRAKHADKNGYIHSKVCAQSPPAAHSVHELEDEKDTLPAAQVL
jgi:hypothetical protein